MGSLGQRIRDLRRERKLTQQELADGIVTSSMVSQIESDRALPSTKVLKQLADKLAVDVSFFQDDLQEKSEQATTHRRAKALMERSEPHHAIPLLVSLVDRHSPQFRETIIYGDLAVCFEQLGDLDKASSMYEQVVRAALERDDVPTAVHAYFHAGQLQRKMGKVPHARMFWFRASELLRRHPDLTMPIAMKIELHLGRVLLSQRQFHQAVERLSVAATLAEKFEATLDHAIIHHGLATAYVEIENYDQALYHTQEAMTLYQSSHHLRGVNQCLVNRGFILRHQEQFTAAIEYLSECVSNRELTTDLSGLSNALSERARCFVELNLLEEAIRDCTRAMSLDPPKQFSLSVLKTLAEAYLKADQPSQALSLAIQGLVLAGTDHPGHLAFLRHIECQALSKLGSSAESIRSGMELANYVLEHLPAV